MKHYNRIALAALFLLAGAASAARAAAPENGVIILPQISQELAGIITQINFAVTLKDNSGKPAVAIWKDGGWRDLKGNATAQLLFPLKSLENPQDPKLRYQLSYEVTYLGGTKRLLAKDLQPLGADSGFKVTPPLPFDQVYVDASKLNFKSKITDTGLFWIDWTIIRKHKGQPWSTTGRLSAKEKQRDGLVADNGEELRAVIKFICVANRKTTQIPWADNSKDLRTLPSGLNIVLTQPVCPGEIERE
jgi:hypothetical protein